MKSTRSALCRSDCVITNFAVITNAVIKRAHCVLPNGQISAHNVGLHGQNLFFLYLGK